MVQFLPQSTQGRLIEETGKGIGSGIGGVLAEAGEYKKNRGRLQQALKSIEDISPEDRKNPTKLLTSVLEATAGIPGGEKYGQALYESLNKQQQQARQQQEQQVLARATRGEPVSSQEMASLSPETQLGLAKIQNQLQQNKQKQEILRSAFPNLGNQSPTQPQQAPPAGQATPQTPGPFTPPQSPQSQPQEEGRAVNLSDQQIAALSTVDPGLARILQDQKKNSPEVVREKTSAQAQAHADIKYNQELQETSKQHELKKQTLDRLENLNKQNVTGKPFEKILEKVGLTALTSSGRREFAADVKNLITDIRSILGGQFSNFEFQTILNAYPSADFSKEANSAIIKNLKNFQDIKSKEVEFAEALKKQNGGKVPYDFQSQVNGMVREYAKTKAEDIKENTQKIFKEEYGISEGNVLMLSPEGEPLNVPKNDIEKYKSLGATLP